MKRYLPELLTCGALPLRHRIIGQVSRVPGAVALGRPTWVHPRNRIPAADDSVATIHAYHFLEHLSGDDVISFMREVKHGADPGEKGILNFTMPLFRMQHLDTHSTTKVRWTEETNYQLPIQRHQLRKFRKVASCSCTSRWLAGVAYRNLCVIGQLLKSDKPAPQVEKWFYPQKPAREGVPGGVAMNEDKTCVPVAVTHHPGAYRPKGVDPTKY